MNARSRELPRRPTHHLDVLHLIPTLDVGGAEQMLLDRLPLLARRGYRVGVCTLADGGALEERFLERGIPLYRCGMRRLVDAPLGLARLRRHLGDLRPRLVHSHLLWSDAALWMLSAVTASRQPSISTVHADPSLVTPLGRVLWRSALRTRPLVLAVSCHSAAVCVRSGARPERVRVVYSGVPDPGQIDINARRRARAALGIGDDDDPVVGTAGRLRTIKGVDVLLQAWRRVETSTPRAHLFIAGDGPDAGALRAEAAQLARPSHVHFMGMLDDVARLYAALDLFVLPSRSEALPLVVLEAMSHGLPIIATAVGGVPEVLENGRSGLLVEVDDDGALGEAVTALLRDSTLRAALGQAARERFLARFTLEREMAEIEEIYRASGVAPDAQREPDARK